MLYLPLIFLKSLLTVWLSRGIPTINFLLSSVNPVILSRKFVEFLVKQMNPSPPARGQVLALQILYSGGGVKTGRLRRIFDGRQATLT